MNEKVLIISTSPRKHGNTESLCEAFAKGAKESGKQVTQINVNDYQIGFCRGCDYCQMKDGMCTQKDDMNKITAMMLWADILVFATPIYFYNMSGQMKVLFDRTYNVYRELPAKKAVLLAACADERTESFDIVLSGFQGYLDCLEHTENAGAVLVPGIFDKGTVPEDLIQQAEEMGRNI